MDQRNTPPKSLPQQVRAAQTLADSGAHTQRPQGLVDRASATLADTGGAAAAPGTPPAPGLAELRFHCRIGGGAMGEVSLFFDVALERWVAVKRIRPEHATGRGLERFLSEARAMAKLRHPGIVQVFGIAQSGAESRILMEYVQGPTGDRPAPKPAQWPDHPSPPLSLEDMVGHAGRLKPRQALEIVAALCDAVEYTHRQNPPIYHRDIKPANVLLDETGKPKLTDFGVAAMQPASGGPSGTLIGTSLGTPGYAAPEQRVNAAAIDGRADVYSLGATLWNLLTGTSPELFRPPEVHPAIARVLSAAMQPDPARRIQSAAALGKALRDIIARPARRRRAAVAAAVPLVALGSVLAFSRPPAPPILPGDARRADAPSERRPEAEKTTAEVVAPVESPIRQVKAEPPPPPPAAPGYRQVTQEQANQIVRKVLDSAITARGLANDMDACDARWSAFGPARPSDSKLVQAGRRREMDAASGILANMRAAKTELRKHLSELEGVAPELRNAAIEASLAVHADAVADSLYRRWLLNPILKDSDWESRFETFWVSDVLNVPAGGWSCRPKEIP